MGKAQSVAIGHLNVADDQIDATTKFLDDLKGVGTVFGFQRPKIFPLQDGADVLPNGTRLYYKAFGGTRSCPRIKRR